MIRGVKLALEFAAAPPPPRGWTRDFILHNVGWDKDADVNTICGQSVEPLPFRAMKSYPPAPRDLPPSGEAYRRYLDAYQTRRQHPAPFGKRLAHWDQTDSRLFQW
jgi:hypothetical protein